MLKELIIFLLFAMMVNARFYQKRLPMTQEKIVKPDFLTRIISRLFNPE